jgi:ABC-type transport system substrate-binding protein
MVPIPGAKAAPAEKSVLRVGALTRTGTLDIREAEDSVSEMILSEIFETPFAPPFGPEAPIPRLFAGPLRRDGGDASRPVFSAQLRPGVFFSDGTPLTPENYRASLLKVDDLHCRCDVEAAGDRLVFRMKSPNPRFDLFLTQTFCAPVLEKGGRFYGTGPMMFPEGASPRELLSAQSLRLVRNPRHRESLPVDEIHFTSLANSAGGGTESLLDAVRRGEVDFTLSLTSVDAAKLQGLPYIASISTGNATGILHFNTEKTALADRRVRRAIAFSIDRREVAKKTYEKNPLAFVASGLLPPLMSHDRDELGFAPNAATSLAAELGASLPKKLSLLVTWSPRPYFPNPRAAADVVVASLRNIGIAVELVFPRDRDDFFDRLKRGSFEMALAGWIADTTDPADFFDSLLSSGQIPDPAKVTATSNNLSRYRNPEMEAALVAFRGEPSEPRRKAIFRILSEDAPLVPLVFGQAVAVYHRNILGFRPSPLGRASLASLRFMK